MSDEILDTGATGPQGNGERPQFLTVLCILTFIGSGLGVLANLLLLVAGGTFAKMIPGGLGEGLFIWLILGLISSGLCLFGAIQMFQLKKMGFMLYAAGSGLYVVVNIASTMLMPSYVEPNWTGVGLGIAIAAGFVAMYNQNRPALIH
ncbi:MAG: hypothetical protein MK078_15020 [Crocinitomicaceae bacterium]|nr:hypothetical protein [Crocinitomicaceae bacterium]